MHSARQIHINAEILQKFELSNLNQSGMDLTQIFFPDQNLTILGEIRSFEAGYKVANCLVFYCNLIDLILNYSTTKALIKILIHNILDPLQGYKTQYLSIRSITPPWKSIRLTVPQKWLVPENGADQQAQIERSGDARLRLKA